MNKPKKSTHENEVMVELRPYSKDNADKEWVRLDEVVIRDASFLHAEMMDKDSLWMSVVRKNGESVRFSITVSKNRQLIMKAENE